MTLGRHRTTRGGDAARGTLPAGPARSTNTAPSTNTARSANPARSIRAALMFTLVASLFAGSVAVDVTADATPAHADSVRDREYWLSDYGIRSAWNTTRGAGVTIAIIDTGVDSSHPDLAGAVTGGADFSGLGAANGQTPVGIDGSSHGTMVASLAAARGSGSGGVIGVAPAASILAISIGFGEGATSSDDQIANAVTWAVDNGADVINMSLTRNTLEWPTSWDTAFLYAAEHDVVVVAAAGNRGSGTSVVGAPATMPGVLAVGGVSRTGTASWDASSQGITIGISAPSEQLVGAIPGGGHALWDGTSGATPIVAGVVALVRAAHPKLDAANVINRIISTAKPAGADGVDPIYGYGLLDAAAAVSANIPVVSANPLGDLKEWVRLYRRAYAEPIPIETAVPVPVTTATPVAEAAAPGGVALPTLADLRDTGIPLLVFGVFGSLAAWMAFVAGKRVRALRGKE
jgi:type VII secretion-associated serine protease mycosin